MVQARLPLVDALDASARQNEAPALRSVIQRIARDVRGGSSLAAALRQHPTTFAPFYVQLVEVGEASGLLGDVLLRLAKHLERAEALRRKVRHALAYPAVVLGTAMAATAFLLAFIVPTFAELYADFGATLPGPTRFVLLVSDALTKHFALVGIALVAFVGAFRFGSRLPRLRAAWDAFLLRLPIMGPLIRRSLVARFSRTLGTLLRNGIPLVMALELVGTAEGHSVLRSQVLAMATGVSQGRRLTAGWGEGHLFPPLIHQLVAVGEDAGELDVMLLHAAAHYEEEVDAAVEGLSALLEPVLIVLIGILLGGILVAMYLPLFDLVDVVGT